MDCSWGAVRGSRVARNVKLCSPPYPGCQSPTGWHYSTFGILKVWNFTRLTYSMGFLWMFSNSRKQSLWYDVHQGVKSLRSLAPLWEVLMNLMAFINWIATSSTRKSSTSEKQHWCYLHNTFSRLEECKIERTNRYIKCTKSSEKVSLNPEYIVSSLAKSASKAWSDIYIAKMISDFKGRINTKKRTAKFRLFACLSIPSGWFERTTYSHEVVSQYENINMTIPIPPSHQYQVHTHRIPLG